MLLIDIGNTRVKWAFFAAGKFTAAGEAVHRGQPGTSLFEPGHIKGPPARSIRIANVAGADLGARIGAELATRFGVTPVFARSAAVAGQLRSGYRDPAQLGVDRWLAMRAAWESGAGPLCVVDAGTATTVDLVAGDGQHLGGLIVPGIGLMEASLRRDTGDLERLARPATDVPQGGQPVARDTASAIRLGAVRATACLVDDCVETLRTRSGACRLVLTGGDGPALQAWIRTPADLRPQLVLEGLARDPFFAVAG